MDPDGGRGFGTEPLSDSLDFVLEAADIGWWDLDLVTNTTRRSLLHDRVFGYEDMLPSWSYDDYLAHVHVDDREMAAQSFETALAGGEPYAIDVRVVWPDGTLHWIFTCGRFLRNDEGVPIRVAGVVGDITKQKAAEIAAAEAQSFAARAAAENLAMLETMLRSAPIGFAFVDREFRFVRLNEVLAEMNGVSADEALGQPAEAVVPGLWPQLEPVFRRVIDERVAIHDVAISGETRAVPGVRRDWMASYYPVLIDELMDISGIGIIVREVTEQRQMESRLRQTQKLEAVGLLASGVAHNFNNILGVITLAAEHAAGSNTDDTVGAELERILKVARSTSGLTRQLLQFSRDHPGTPELVDVSACVESVAAFLAPTLGDHISATTHTDTASTIRIDRTELEQLLINLAINARDAMPDGGELSFRTQDITIDDHVAGLQPGRYVEICVQDAGTGMTPDVVERAFEPFFTTKADRGGSGLGLSTVHGIAAAADGDAQIHSTPGDGTTISVRFPVCDDPDDSPEADAEQTGPTFAGRRILVVDDQESLRTLVERILSGAGYDVHAGTARDIVEMSQTATVAPDLLVTDVTMPDLSGPELARILSQRWPTLAVLYMSGHSGDALDSLVQGPTSETPRLLSKPFGTHDLLRAVSSALQAADEVRIPAS